MARDDDPRTEWLTMFEAMERSGVTYVELQRLADEGLVRTRPSGATLLYSADGLATMAATRPSAVALPPELTARERRRGRLARRRR